MLVSDLWVAGVVDCVVGDRFLVKSIPPSLAFDPDGAWLDREGARWRWPVGVVTPMGTVGAEVGQEPTGSVPVTHPTAPRWREVESVSNGVLPECPHGCPEILPHEHLDPGGGKRWFQARPVDGAARVYDVPVTHPTAGHDVPSRGLTISECEPRDCAICGEPVIGSAVGLDAPPVYHAACAATEAAIRAVEVVPARRPSEADAARAERARVWNAAEKAGAAEHAARTAARCPMTALHDLAETCSWGADVVKAGLPHLEARELFFDELAEDPRWDPVAVSVAKDLSDRHVFEIIRNAEGLGDPNAPEGKCGVHSLEWARLIHLSVGEQRKTMVRAANLHTETLGRFLKACACALGDANVQAEGGAQ